MINRSFAENNPNSVHLGVTLGMFSDKMSLTLNITVQSTQDLISSAFQCCAVAFIEKLDAQSLNLSPEEFERYMSGQASPRFHSAEGDQQQAGPGASNPVLEQLNHTLEQLSGLICRQERLMEAAQSTQADLLSWTECVQREVSSILEEYPLEILPRTASAIDAHVDSDRLPLPLTPQMCGQ